jgi:hypothetical protein
LGFFILRRKKTFLKIKLDVVFKQVPIALTGRHRPIWWWP